jgi:hypothetical protein
LIAVGSASKLLTGFGIAIVWSVSSQADVTTCDAVVNIAQVFHGPDVAVSLSSSNSSERKFCTFSINGYVADATAPPEFTKMAMAAHDGWKLWAATKQPDVNTVKFLPYLLFAADTRIDMAQFKDAVQLIDKETEQLTSCYSDFFTGKAPDLILSDGNLLCKMAGENTLQTVLIVGPVVRTVFIQRA